MKKIILLSMLSLSVCVNSTVILANEPEKKDDRKAVVILFNPPKGMEKEFLETFVKEQTSNLTATTATQKKQTES